MARTIVSIDPGIENALTMRLAKAPTNIPDARRPLPFNCVPEAMPPWDGPEAVKQHGHRLFEELANHPAVKKAIELALMQPPGQTQPVYFHLNEDIAERLCWETLYSNDKKFIGLDARWPIGRIADSVVDRLLAPRDFAPPLRIAAVLSALDRQAAEQWQGLCDAVQAVRDGGLDAEMLVLVGEEDLLAAIGDEIAGGLPATRVAPVPDRAAQFEELLNEFEPQILHFFCHGSASHGVPRLEVATILDWAEGNTTGSLKLSVDDLQNMPAMADVWLVVLNCCESGRAEENTHSMAHTLVSNVVPAAIGTLEPFEVSDAHELCLGFYPQLFKDLARVLEQPGDDSLVELEWATALRGARRSLSEKHDNDPSNHREWALPVLYARPEPFMLRVPGVGPAATPDEIRVWQQRAQVVAGYLKALPPDTGMDVREAALGILADVPNWLKPDAFGNFEQPGQADAAVAPAPGVPAGG